MSYYLIQRRGSWAIVETAACVIDAPTEAHARAKACDLTGELEFGSNLTATCDPLVGHITFPGGARFFEVNRAEREAGVADVVLTPKERG